MYKNKRKGKGKRKKQELDEIMGIIYDSRRKYHTVGALSYRFDKDQFPQTTAGNLDKFRHALPSFVTI